MEKKKPTFRRHDSHKKARVSIAWRKPRGLHNKVRLGMRGYSRAIAVGYGRSQAVKGTATNGLLPVVIYTIAELDALDTKKECAVIPRTMGARKSIMLLEHAQTKKIIVLNATDIAQKIATLKKDFDERKKVKSTRKKKTVVAKKSLDETVAAEKKPIDEKAAKAEQNKIYTKKV